VTFTITADVTLYARWRPIFAVTYDDNGTTSGVVHTVGPSLYIVDTVVMVLDNTGFLERTGYAFVGWNDNSGGSGESYNVNATFQITADVTLYARWRPIFAVTYDRNGITTTGNVPVDGSSPYIVDTLVTVLGNTGPLVNPGNTFSIWSTSADGSGTEYNAGETFTISADVTLYARWTPPTP
jgi:uncharacterized repeat protein (TIGR02543 family)